MLASGDAVGGVGALEESLALRSQLKDKLGTQFSCFTSTKVQILTQQALPGIAEVLNRLGLALIDIAFHLQASSTTN
jgi:hypothetical protein